MLEPQNFDVTTSPTEGVAIHEQGMAPYHNRTGDNWFFGDHWFCCPNVEGSVATATFTLEKAMEGDLFFHLTQAPDYGRIRIALDGTVVVPDFDGYYEHVRSVLVPAGQTRLDPGSHTLTIKTLGKNENSTNCFWGIDYIRIGGEPPKIEKDSVVVPSGRS